MPPHSMLDLSLCLGITYGAVVYLLWKHQKYLLQNSSLFTVCEFELLFQDIITAWSWKVIFGWHYLRSHNIFYGYIFPNIQCDVLCLDTLCASDYIILNFTLSLPADSTHISWIHSLLKYKQVRLVYRFEYSIYSYRSCRNRNNQIYKIKWKGYTGYFYRFLGSRTNSDWLWRIRVFFKILHQNMFRISMFNRKIR